MVFWYDSTTPLSWDAVLIVSSWRACTLAAAPVTAQPPTCRPAVNPRLTCSHHRAGGPRPGRRNSGQPPGRDSLPPGFGWPIKLRHAPLAFQGAISSMVIGSPGMVFDACQNSVRSVLTLQVGGTRSMATRWSSTFSHVRWRSRSPLTKWQSFRQPPTVSPPPDGHFLAARREQTIAARGHS